MWGTVKKGKYGRSQTGQEKIYTGWFIDNDDHLFSYLGQLFGYLKILDDKVKKPHENPSVGIVLCKEANKAYAQYAVQDYSKPMGVATYSTLAEMPEEMRQTLPDVEELKKLL